MSASAKVTIAAASVDLTNSANCPKLEISGAGSGAQDLQAARISVEAVCSDAPASTSTLRFVLSDGSQAIAYVDAALSAPTTAIRSALAGASGNYFLAIEFPNGVDILDLCGAGKAGLVWHVTSAAFMTNVSSLIVRAFAVVPI